MAEGNSRNVQLHTGELALIVARKRSLIEVGYELGHGGGGLVYVDFNSQMTLGHRRG